MKLYKSLACDNYTAVNNQIKAYIESTGLVSTTNQFWNALPTMEFVRAVPLFKNWLESHDLKLHSLALTVGRTPDCCSLHIDTPPARFKVSWPIENTAHTFNRWFKPIVSDLTSHVNPHGGQVFTDLEQFEEIARKEVIEPCIIDASIPHDVWISDQATYPRLGLQCMLFNEPGEL